MQEAIDELVRNYFKDETYTIESVPFGLTNLTKIITIDGEKYVIRIYNPYTKNIEGIEFESQITSFLNKKDLSFQVPVFLHTLTGNEYVQFSNGMLGALVSFVEGIVPALLDIKYAAEFGHVVGEISSTLINYETGLLEYQGKSFLEIYALHPLADHLAVISFMENPPFQIPETNLTFYQEMISSLDKNMHKLMELPKQLVHHDLLIFNLLAQNNKIVGVLDFDFTSIDASFMEFTICLNHILQMSNGSLEMAEAFIQGYVRHRKSLQLMTQVYHIAVLHFYIGMHHSGNDIKENFNYIFNQFYNRNNWLNKNSSSIKQLLELHML
ncbi:hypothetical protein GCM10008018_54460 [Paenibacillus marchantiophytorum]|uniref:Aminoglycoside phosphotransferase domain-containing protein n=1 Tax=Paenibacillus marchantiophytorum TaxID=1619310 RepID=A0ABQ1F7U9_9BACL|nr:phosphotransferase [Paenibacillus marchantiophytorum]GGA01191.1 hypothetical protein GCM10008018_54460 [Paenibacillus marchantiophytorum]